jgi:hypothetical protein
MPAQRGVCDSSADKGVIVRQRILFFLIAMGLAAFGYSQQANYPAGGGISNSPSASQTIQGTQAGVTGLIIKNPTNASQTQLSVQRADGQVEFQVGQFGASGPAVIQFGSTSVGGQLYQFSNGQTQANNSTTLDWPIVQALSSTTPATPVSSTAFVFPNNQTVAGIYEVTYYSVVTTTGVGGTSFTLNMIYTDAQGAQTKPVFTNSTFTAGDVNQGTFIVQNQTTGTNTISYSVTEAGTFTTHPVLALKFVVKRIQ